MSQSQNPQPDPDDMRRLFEQFLSDAESNPAMAEAMQAFDLNLSGDAISSIAGQLAAMFGASPTDGLNLELCTDMARKTVAAGGDALVDDRQRKAVGDAVGVANLWLDEVTSISASELHAVALSRAEWVDRTMPTWGKLVGPVALAVNKAMTSALRGQLGDLGERMESGDLPGLPGMPGGADPMGALGGPGGMAAFMQQLEPMLEKMSASMFGAQIGQAVGALAGEVVSGTEVGLPLLPAGSVAILPANVSRFCEGLGVDEAQVLLYLAVREAARARLFADVPWLGPQLVSVVQAYASDISVDTEGIEAKLTGIDPSDPAAIQEALANGLFSPVPSEAQKRALVRLETFLALVEGWLDVVTDRATAGHLPQAAALGEAVRRRRASGGPAEHTFHHLVGLELRPRRLRDAANLFAALESAGGAAARDAAWEHPDIAPGDADLDDPLGYVERIRRASGSQSPDPASSDPSSGPSAQTTASTESPAAGASGGPARPAGTAGSLDPEMDDMDAALARLLDEEAGNGDSRS
ncbi:MAG: zinc-dependent metalloprotease [Micrococcales bacterium]|nr:zinc-dependent metalloprotease [Micrococcales bacterium]